MSASTSATEVVVINCGSPSLKFAWLDAASGKVFATGLAERLGGADAGVRLDRDGHTTRQPLPNAEHGPALERLVALCWPQGPSAGLLAVGHRVVHGGEQFREPRIVDADVIAGIEACAELAPLHNPANLLGIRVAQEHFLRLPQVAVFDTSFHHTMPPPAFTYGVPYEWREQYQARRYGFHGTSHQFVSLEAARLLGRAAEDCQLITAHLGNGASVCAVRNGRSVDTSMGLTPLEGLVMGTRCGDVDANLTEYIVRKAGLPFHEVIDALNRQSGLLGISGLSNDMRALIEAAAGGHERARLAIDVFCYRLARWILAMAAGLERIDALVFTAGIGERSALVRAKTLASLELLRPELDAARNATDGRDSGGVIMRAGGQGLLAMVVPTNEEWMIARFAARLCRGGAPQAPSLPPADSAALSSG